MPESRVVKENADLLAFEPLPIDIGITNSFKLGLREEAGVWQKNARRVNSTSVNSTKIPSSLDIISIWNLKMTT